MINLVDCTLRDGGHINKSHFGEKVIRNVIKSLVESKVNVIEIGMLRTLEYNPDVSLFNSVQQAKEFVIKHPNIEYSLMAQQDQYDINLLEECDGTIEHIRVSFHNYDFDEGIEFAKGVIKKGYKCHVNPINLQGYSDKELIDIISKINEIKPHTFTIVDTFGAMTEKELSRIVLIIDNNLDSDIAIGLHLHENLGLSYSLAQFFTRIKPPKRNISIDGSLNGMGRVPGNLNIELFMNFMNRFYNTNYDLNPIYDAIDDYILPIKKEIPWGYSLPYALSAQHGLHRTYAEFLISKNKLKTKDIQEILSRVAPNKKAAYDPKYIQELFIDFLSRDIDDTLYKNKLKDELSSGRKILLLAPGGSINRDKDKIQDFIFKNKPIIISVHFSPIAWGIKSDYIFFNNVKRLEQCELNNEKIILTSDLAENAKTEDYVLNFSSLAKYNSDSSLLMLLELFKLMDIKELYIAGFDGFQNKNLSYCSNSLIPTDEQISYKFNNDDFVKEIIRNNYSDLKITTLTKSHYFDTDKTFVEVDVCLKQ